MTTPIVSYLTQVEVIQLGPYTDEINRDVKWYGSWVSHYFHQGSFNILLAALNILPITLLLCPIVNVITYVALAQIFKGKENMLCKEAMEKGNAVGAYIMTERGADPKQKNAQGQSLLDLFAIKGGLAEGFSAQDLNICETLFKKGVEANASYPGFRVLLDAAIAKRRVELILALVELGLSPTASWSAYVPKPQIESLALPAWSTVEELPLINSLNPIGEDLNKIAINETLQKFSQKDNPLYQIMRIFGQSMRNCPIVLGESEVERRSLISALSREILQGKVPPVLTQKRIISIDLAILDGITAMKGLETLLSAYSAQLKSHPNFIFYIHNFEIFEKATTAHPKMKKTLVEWAETGRVVFSMSPAIYKRYFSQDHLIQKGFTQIEVSKPSEKEALLLLHEMKKELELGHQVTFTNSAIEAAIQMARYLPNATLPQSAYEILDAAASLLKEQDTKGSLALQEAERKQKDLQFERRIFMLKNNKTSQKRLERIDEQLQKLEAEIEQLSIQDSEELAVKKQYIEIQAKQVYLNYLDTILKAAMQRALGKLKQNLIDLRTSRQEVKQSSAQDSEELATKKQYRKLQANPAQPKYVDSNFKTAVQPFLDEIKQALTNLETFKQMSNIKFEVDRELVAAVVSLRSGIPLDHVRGADAEKLRNLAISLGQEVIGQKKAVKTIAKTLKTARVGLRNESKPRAVFLCAGTSGTGKTEMAKAIARNLFGDERNMTRLDMSEYQAKENKSRLIGAPPGYVGYKEGGQLTEALKRNPYQVILIDEVEKASPDVLTTFLQVFSDGRLTDGQGNTVDCSQAVFLMTTNLGSREIAANYAHYSLWNPLNWGLRYQLWKYGHFSPEAIIRHALKNSEHFSYELIGRLKIVTFNPLTRAKDLKQIVSKALKQYQEQIMKVQGIELKWSKKVVSALAKTGASIEFGVRPLIDRVEDNVLNALSNQILEGEIKEGDTVEIDFDTEKKQLIFQPINE